MFDGICGDNAVADGHVVLQCEVCDTFCALVSERPYRKAFEFDTALEMMIEDNKDLDMGIFLEFIKLYHSEEFEEIKEYVTFTNRKKHYLHGA